MGHGDAGTGPHAACEGCRFVDSNHCPIIDWAWETASSGKPTPAARQRGPETTRWRLDTVPARIHAKISCVTPQSNLDVVLQGDTVHPAHGQSTDSMEPCCLRVSARTNSQRIFSVFAQKPSGLHPTCSTSQTVPPIRRGPPGTCRVIPSACGESKVVAAC